MRRFLLASLLAVGSLSAQTAPGPNPQARAAEPPPGSGVAYIRENYTKYEYKIPMRDGVKLFTAVYVPKEVASDGKTYPILLQRTPYTVRPYGVDQYPPTLGPSELFAREKFIFAYQDVRGRYMSEGDFTITRPLNPKKTGAKDTDESTDAYDTIDWLVKNVKGNTGKVGIWGISQPGFFATAALIDAHPALVAVSPQAPVTDYYMGDDSYHNGAFMLAARFNMYTGFKPREGDPAPPPNAQPFDYGTPDGYDFYLSLGPLANVDEKYFKHNQPYWSMHMKNATYNEFWQSRSIWKYLDRGVKPAVMLVGGWFDAEDAQGLYRQFAMLEKNSPPPQDMIVVGPWTHGGFARGDGDRVGNINFGSKTAVYYREHIEFPFFLYHLKGRGNGNFPKAWVFETGLNQWQRFDAWPPKTAKPTPLYLGEKGTVSWRQPGTEVFDEYLSDPAKPVPYIGHVLMGMRYDYMTEDQRFAATRPDVLVYKSEVLDHDVTVMGPITVDLKVSTTGTDSDFDVKLIDVLPADFPDYSAPPATPATPQAARQQPANAIKLGGYQMLVRGEPFRGKYRKSFEKPVPFQPGKPDRITFTMPDIAHTFRAGHRIMVQVQSSWFPLTDRNPQKFVDIPQALSTDFVKATQHVYLGGPEGSKLVLPIVE